MPLNILVTGGAGYIGSTLVGYLLALNYHVTVIDNYLTHQQENSLFACCADPKFRFVRGDVRDEAQMKKLMADKDAIIPLAAIVGARACDRDPDLAKSINRDVIIMLNELRSNEQMMIYPCTNSGYGSNSGEVYCTEETLLEPISLYGVAKVEAEKALLDSGTAISLRLATVFGLSPRMRLDLLVNDFTYRASKDRFLILYEEHFKRNYVHVRDVARAFCFCLKHYEDMTGEPYNVGLNEANLSKRELALAIKKHVPNLYIHCAKIGLDPDRRNYIVSNGKINDKGFFAERTVDMGIQELLKGYSMMSPGSYYNA